MSSRRRAASLISSLDDKGPWSARLLSAAEQWAKIYTQFARTLLRLCVERADSPRNTGNYERSDFMRFLHYIYVPTHLCILYIKKPKFCLLGNKYFIWQSGFMKEGGNINAFPRKILSSYQGLCVFCAYDRFLIKTIACWTHWPVKLWGGGKVEPYITVIGIFASPRRPSASRAPCYFIAAAYLN